MDLFNRSGNQGSTIGPANEREIQDRLKRRYLDRLSQRSKKLRKNMMERDWEELREECRHISSTGENFGFPALAKLAQLAEDAIPTGRIPRASALPHARQAIEALVAAIDLAITERV